MRLAALFGTGLLAFAALTVSAQESGPSPYEGVLKELLANLGRLTDVLTTVKDEPSVQAAVPEVKKVVVQLGELRNKAKALPQPDKAEKERITRIYRPKLEEAIHKQLAEVARVKTIPGGSDLVKLMKPPEEKTK